MFTSRLADVLRATCQSLISREEGDQSSLARRVRALYAAQAAGTEAEREVAMGQARAAAAEGTVWARYSSVALPSMSKPKTPVPGAAPWSSMGWSPDKTSGMG
jgi:hypothetical protein